MSSDASSSAVSSPRLHDPTLSEPSSPRNGTPTKRNNGNGKVEKFEVKSVSIPYGKEQDGIVYYTVNVITANDEKWSCLKRFSAFERLHQVLMDLFGHRGFPPGADLPPKKFKFFVSHVSDHFIEERRCLLDSYLQKMMKVPEVIRSDVWLDFLSSDELDHFVDPPEVKLEPAEDAEITSIAIPQTRLMSDHVLYQVDVSNAKKRKTFSKWTVLKRFGQFYDLDAQLRLDFGEDESILSILPASPQRQSKLLYDHMEAHFIEHRRVLLEHYLVKLLNIPPVAKNVNFLAFLGVQI